MSQTLRNLIRSALAAAMAVYGAGCTSDDATGGSDPTHTVDVGATDAWGTGGVRSPLGVAGKPVIETETGFVIGDELLVRFVGKAQAADQLDAVARAGGTITYRSSRTGFTVVRFASVDATEQAVQTLRADARVAEVLHNHVCEGTGIGTAPTYELGVTQWNLYAMDLDPFATRHTVEGVQVAVLDTGVAYEDYSDAFGTYEQAPDLAGVDFAAGYDFINDDAHPNDDQRHGTHVTGVIAAARGIEALGEGATIIPIKVLDGSNAGTELALAEGLMFAADHGAQLANMSLSFPPTYFPSRLLQNAVDYASSHGVIMIAAAGNHDENLVAYPAAFRDVIAVGASDLPDDYAVDPSVDPQEQWDDTLGVLRRAPYSDHGYKLDVLSPAGTIDGDANSDGNPEAVLAQTFALGHPTEFHYYYYAGTSQAAAQATGLATRLLHANPDLDAYQLRAILGENAKRSDARAVLSTEAGRGFIRGSKTIAAAGNPHATDDRPRFFANVVVTLHDVASTVVGRAHVEILDESGKPVPGMTIYGMWSGAAFAQVTAVTGSDGVAELQSEPLSGNYLVAFQVDAVSKGNGCHQVFDRPRGFLRTDTVSLDLLTTFGSGIGTAPTGIGTAPTSSSSGASDTPWWVPSGAGIGTAPTIPLPTDPAMTPLTIAFDPALFAGTNYRPTLLLPNLSWGLATAPMAVAADEAWFLATFPGAAERRVVSYGRGYGASGLLFNDTSFPTPLGETASGDRIALIILTFVSGIGTAPTTVAGIGTAPTMIVDRTYSGIDDALALSYDTLITDWYASASGIGTAPTYSDAWLFDEATFNRLSALTNAYLAFAALEIAKPVASYGDALSAAAMPMAPVSPASDGAGLGNQLFTAP